MQLSVFVHVARILRDIKECQLNNIIVTCLIHTHTHTHTLTHTQVSELARETLTSLSSPHNNPHTLREQLRITGALDTLANMGECVWGGGAHWGLGIHL